MYVNASKFGDDTNTSVCIIDSLDFYRKKKQTEKAAQILNTEHYRKGHTKTDNSAHRKAGGYTDDNVKIYGL